MENNVDREGDLLIWSLRS